MIKYLYMPGHTNATRALAAQLDYKPSMFLAPGPPRDPDSWMPDHDTEEIRWLRLYKKLDALIGTVFAGDPHDYTGPVTLNYESYGRMYRPLAPDGEPWPTTKWDSYHNHRDLCVRVKRRYRLRLSLWGLLHDIGYWGRPNHDLQGVALFNRLHEEVDYLTPSAYFRGASWDEEQARRNIEWSDTFGKPLDGQLNPWKRRRRGQPWVAMSQEDIKLATEICLEAHNMASVTLWSMVTKLNVDNEQAPMAPEWNSEHEIGRQHDRCLRWISEVAG